MIFANTDKELTLLYSSKEGVGKQILALAQTENIPIRDIDLNEVKLTQTHWAEIAKRMRIEVHELVNTESSHFLQKFGKADGLSEDDWLTLLVNNPDVLRAPIVMKGEKLVAMENPQDMLQFVK